MPHKKPDFRGIRRSFSITSIPSNTEISLGVKFYEPSSSFKQALSKLQPGDRLTATQISGDFILLKQINKPLLLVAGEIAYRELLEKSKTKVIVASPDELENLPSNWLHIKTARIDFKEISELIPNI